MNSALLDGFRVKQLEAWQLAEDNYEALKDVKTKSFDVDGFTVKAQFNPARIVSSSAKVDAKSISERKCFLCSENRPPQQHSLLWHKRYSILVNPYPIYKRHFTVPDNTHTDQLIAGRIEDMVTLAQQTYGYTVFYNGPKCGASAPDHMHFQAIATNFLTLPTALLTSKRNVLAEIGSNGNVLSYVDALPLNVFLIEAQTPGKAAKLFSKLYDAMPVADGEKEPMMNVLCYQSALSTNVVVIPRKRHRPSFYGTEGEEQMLLSPASVDLGGVFVMPREKDFDRLDANIVRRVYSELCLSDEEMQAIISKIKK